MPIHRSRTRALLAILLLACSALVLSACDPTLPMTTLDPQGNHAQNIYDLMIAIFWAALAVFIVVEGLLLYSVFRFRRRPNSGIPVQIHGNTRIEILWTVVPAIIVLVIAVLTFRTQALNAQMPEDALRIEAVGHQWWFEFRYPQEGIVTASDMYVPAGRDVIVELSARDVVHNFWVPKLAGKTYNIPGKTNYLSFRTDQPGIYRGQCAEFCGEAHAQMAFNVIVVAPDQYDRWVAEHTTVPVIPAGDAEQGQLLFTQRGCIGCHVIDGNVQAVGLSGPNLTYYANRTTIAAGVLPNTRENMARWLRNPAEVKPGNLMSVQVREGTLSEQDIAYLIEYLYSMELSTALPDPR